MGSLGLPEDGRVYLDTNCVIYAVECIKPYDALPAPLWSAVDSRRLSLITSQLTLLEATIKPIRSTDARLEHLFREFLLASGGLSLASIDLAVLDRAARIRAATRLATPDAIHAATALGATVSAFLTNDPKFRRVMGLPVCVLSEYL